MTPIRIILVDDHAIVRTALASLLEAEPDLEVIAQATDGEEAAEMADRLQPDLVLIDCAMPRMNGIQATRLITVTCPDVTVIGLSMHDTRTMEREMLRAGAVAYIEKGAALDDLLTVIRAACGRRARGPSPKRPAR